MAAVDETLAQEDDALLDDGGSRSEESWLRAAARVSYPPARDLHAWRRSLLPHQGSVIGDKYRIEEMLGEGGMGAVFRATQLLTDKPVAIKWMLRAPDDATAVERLMREARAAARVRHPNVVDVYDIASTAEASYLVMELLLGESLAQRLDRGRLSVVEAVSLLLPAMRGVAEVHRQGVVHRDLKPANIFLPVAADGTSTGAKVLDFGISVSIEQDGGRADTALTQEGALLGTPAYMPPEQLQDAHDVDERTDVYALGVILYEMVSGALPYAAGSYNALLMAIATEAPRPLGSLCPGLPPAFVDVVARAMQRDRSQRFQQVTELIDALGPFARDGDATSVPPTLTVEKPAAGTLSRALLVALMLLLIGAAWWWTDKSAVSPTVAAPVANEAAASPHTIEPSTAVPAPQAQALPAVEPAGVPTAEIKVPSADDRASRPARERSSVTKGALQPSAGTKSGRAGAITLDDL